MKVKDFENVQSETGLKGCRWSSLNAPGTETPQSHPHWELGEFPFLDISRSPLGNQNGLPSMKVKNLIINLSSTDIPDILICGNCKDLFNNLTDMIEHKKKYCKLRFTCKCGPPPPPTPAPQQALAPTSRSRGFTGNHAYSIGGDQPLKKCALLERCVQIRMSKKGEGWVTQGRVHVT